MAATREAEFLDRIRVRLRERKGPAVPHPGRLAFRTGDDQQGDTAEGGDTGAEGRIVQFSRELEAVGGEAIRAERYAAAAEIVLEKCRTMGWRTWVRHEDARLDRLRLEERIVEMGDTALDVQRSAESGERDRSIWDADVGLTWAEAGIAETGTIALFTAPDRSRRVSLVPFAHIAILPVEDLFTTRGQLFRRLREEEEGEFPSSLTLVTGPSRTSDIENDKTIGVHGPRFEIVILVG